LINSSNPANAYRVIAGSQAAAAKLKLTVRPIEVGTPDDLERAFATIDRQIDAMSVPNDGMFYNERPRIAELANVISQSAIACDVAFEINHSL
jgi:hypothetical protein